MKKIGICAGSTIDEALQKLKKEQSDCDEVCYCCFNGNTLYSTDTLDEAYVKVTGKTKSEHDEELRKRHEEYERQEAEHKAKIPEMAKEYISRARGLVKEEKLDYWDNIVPIRLGDIYHGMELEQTLNACKIMRDESLTYDERLHKAYKAFMDCGHSGYSAGLTASMYRHFVPDGDDLADAVMNFRFDKKENDDIRLVEADATEYKQEEGEAGIYKAIRDAAAVCYQTDVEKMKLEPKEFVEQVLLKNGHTRPLEFGTVYLKVPYIDKDTLEHYQNTLWTKIVIDNFQYVYITTNMRVIMQGWYPTDKEAFEHGYDANFLDDFKYLCDSPTSRHKKRRTFNIIASRGATDDMRTHITLSSMCESTRFCNYSKGKFDGRLTFINPVWWKDKNEVYDTLIEQFKIDETKYVSASTYCTEAQQLKRITPLGIKAELRLCGFKDAWDNFLWRRCDSHADPECRIIAEKIKSVLDS